LRPLACILIMMRLCPSLVGADAWPYELYSIA
jgi:hypothetical protein